jgi:hypothetical protein
LVEPTPQVLHEYSRSPLHVYPRALYKPAREHIEKVHGKGIVSFLQTRVGKHTHEADEARLFSDFNYLGAYAHLVRPDLVALAPMDFDERRKMTLPLPFIDPPLCQGNARLADSPARRAELIKGLDAVWNLGTRTCQDLLTMWLDWLAADAIMLANMKAKARNITAAAQPGGKPSSAKK